jgi:hypothetical protein
MAVQPVTTPCLVSDASGEVDIAALYRWIAPALLIRRVYRQPLLLGKALKIDGAFDVITEKF